MRRGVEGGVANADLAKNRGLQPIVALIGGFKSLSGVDANVTLGLTLILAILVLGLAAAWLAFRAGYRLKG